MVVNQGSDYRFLSVSRYKVVSCHGGERGFESHRGRLSSPGVAKTTKDNYIFSGNIKK